METEFLRKTAVPGEEDAALKLRTTCSLVLLVRSLFGGIYDSVTSPAAMAHPRGGAPAAAPGIVRSRCTQWLLFLETHCVIFH